MNAKQLSMFKITDGKGFQITFANGVTVSVQFGLGNYCSNRNDEHLKYGSISCENAEIAVWDKNGVDILSEYLKLNGESQRNELGWVDANKVSVIMNWARRRDESLNIQ